MSDWKSGFVYSNNLFIAQFTQITKMTSLYSHYNYTENLPEFTRRLGPLEAFFACAAQTRNK